MSDEQTKTEIVRTENVYLGVEHIRFLEDLVDKLRKDCQYKASKAQIIRLLVENAMKRNIAVDAVTNEDELRQLLDMPADGEPTRIRKK